MTDADPSENASVLRESVPSEESKLFQWILDNFPKWIVDVSPGFSKELERFNLDWAFSCVNLGLEPKKVILVRSCYIETQMTTHTVIRRVIEKLLVLGYSVMDANAFVKCAMCSKVIVSEKCLGRYTFSGTCQGCRKYDPREPLAFERMDATPSDVTSLLAPPPSMESVAEEKED